MARIKLAALAALVLLLAACSGLEIDAWPPGEFAAGRYQTYSWRSQPIVNSTYSRDPIYQVDPIIRDVLDDALRAKGYRKVGRDGDFTVDYIFAQGVALGAPSEDTSNISPRAGVRPNTNISGAQRDNAIALSGVKETRNIALQFNDGKRDVEVWRAVITKIIANVNNEDTQRNRKVLGDAVNRAMRELPTAS
jgi:hypothetical protein